MSGDGPGAAEGMAVVYEMGRPHLDERQRRIVLGAGAGRPGRGGGKGGGGGRGGGPGAGGPGGPGGRGGTGGGGGGERGGGGGVRGGGGGGGGPPDRGARGAGGAAGGPERRGRGHGGGRKPVTATDPRLVPALLAMVDPGARGDPESPLQWTLKSTRELARALTAAGHACSDRTVARLLKGEGYSLQGNAKVAEGKQH